MNIKKILYIIFGCISFGLGAVGAVLPVLPTFPFLIFAAFCFARSSKKLDKWFKGTKLYKNNLETYAPGLNFTGMLMTILDCLEESVLRSWPTAFIPVRKRLPA